LFSPFTHTFLQTFEICDDVDAIAFLREGHFPRHTTIANRLDYGNRLNLFAAAGRREKTTPDESTQS